MGVPPPSPLSPFYLYNFLRVLLGMGLMQSALHTGGVFQVQRATQRMRAQCVGGQLVVQLTGDETTNGPGLPPSLPVASPPGTTRE